MARGGYRPGSGRPKGSGRTVVAPVAALPSVPADIAEAAQEAGLTPFDYLMRVMRSPDADVVRRDRAAALLLPFSHPKAGEQGKKAAAAQAAKVAATSKYAQGEPPRLAVIGKKAAAQADAKTAQAGTDWETLLNPKEKL